LADEYLIVYLIGKDAVKVEKDGRNGEDHVLVEKVLNNVRDTPVVPVTMHKKHSP